MVHLNYEINAEGLLVLYNTRFPADHRRFNRIRVEFWLTILRNICTSGEGKVKNCSL